MDSILQSQYKPIIDQAIKKLKEMQTKYIMPGVSFMYSPAEL